ncbi:family 10 glycosylhydrolase [Methylocaldum szegediense]|uniref:GHL10 domain-containing protein n=1 Tax=Methylocaldum szegediense TaxID=73780 RepID=A0ABN8X054_9GAMM|nr:family 10 glycosylhydrolase [Methylocaldum szegediense]CAI8789133.1 GHL10 domain-containing protein [Methylocaldum szegediense]
MVRKGLRLFSARTALSIFGLLGALLAAFCISAKPKDEALVSFEGFSETRSPVLKPVSGAAIEHIDEVGSVLRIPKRGRAELALPQSFSLRSGTISFWLKPSWQDSTASHTLASMEWDKGSYLVISQGWWEPKGANRFYFVVSNRDSFHCSAPYRLQTNTWTLITAVWKTGKDGFCRLYADDELVAKSAFSGNPDRLPKSPLVFGSDAPTRQADGREMEGSIKGIVISQSALTHEQIHARYIDAIREKPVLAAGKSYWTGSDDLASRKEKHRSSMETGRENRIIFDEDIGWALSRDNTDTVLRRIKDAGFNVYVPCVWHGRGAYFPSTNAHVDTRVKQRIDKGDDPLRYLITKAHSMGIEVHPWFTVAKREDGRYPKFFDEGTPEGAYNVHIPEFRTFIVDVITDMAKRYTVDGVNLDYIRTLGVCVSKFCQQDYQEKHRKSLLSDTGKQSIDPDAYDRIQRWQDEAVSDIVQRVSDGVRRARPHTIVSVDAYDDPDAKRRPLEGRNPFLWANRGWVDVIFQMNYTKRLNVEKTEKLRQRLDNKNKLFILFANYQAMGRKQVPKPYDIMEDYIQVIRTRWPETGIAVYLYKHLTDQQIRSLRQGAFRRQAVPTWKAQRG